MKNIKKYIRKKLFEYFKDEIIRHTQGNVSEHFGIARILDKYVVPIKLCNEGEFVEPRWCRGYRDNIPVNELSRLEKMRTFFVDDLKAQLIKGVSEYIEVEKIENGDGIERYKVSIGVYQEMK